MNQTLSKTSLLLLSFVALSCAVVADETCPEQFFGLTLPDTSKQCRIFGVKKPSTLSFYLDASPESVISGFNDQLPEAQQTKYPKLWALLSESPKLRVYIYSDGPGTQINIRAE